jgi:hypothetical protein
MEKIRRKTYLQGEKGTEAQSLLLDDESFQLGNLPVIFNIIYY